MGPPTPTISQSSETYFPVSVAEDAPDASGPMVELVRGTRAVLVGSRLYAFRRSAGEMPLSSAQSASAAEGFAVVMDIFGTFKDGVGLEVCGIEGGFERLVIVVVVAAVLRGVLLHALV